MANMNLMLLSCHRSQCCGLLSSLFCVALLSFAKTNLSPSALWCNLIFSHLHTWEKDFYVCFKNLRNWGRFVRPVWHKNKNKQTNKNKNLRNRGRFVRPARHKPSAASLAARRRLSPGQRPLKKMCHIELETSFCKNTRYCQILKKHLMTWAWLLLETKETLFSKPLWPRLVPGLSVWSRPLKHKMEIVTRCS